MIRATGILAACLLGSAAGLLPTSPAIAAGVVAQGPCTYALDRCLLFFNDTSPIPVVRSFTFNMPGAGKVVVRFDGTMQCVVNLHTNDQDVIDLAGQIVTTAAALPNYKAAGGARYGMRINVPNADPYDSSIAVNLAASRTITYGSGGSKTVYYKLTQLRMDPATYCVVYSAAFTVMTFP